MNTNQQKVVSNLRKHFLLTTKQLDPIVNRSLEETNGVYFKLEDYEGDLPNSIKEAQFFVSSEKITKLDTLWNYQKLINSTVYANYNDVKHNAYNEFIFCFVVGDPFIMRESDIYAGLGGIFCKSPDMETGIIIEPLKNFLIENFEAPEWCE